MIHVNMDDAMEFSQEYWSLMEHSENILSRRDIVELKRRSSSLSDAELDEILYTFFCAGLEVKDWLFAVACANLGIKFPRLNSLDHRPIEFSLMCLGECPQAIQWLVDHGEDIDGKDFISGFAPIHTAVRLQQPENVAKIISLGADLNSAYDSDGITALMIAAALGNETIVTMLINGGAEIGSVDILGDDAIAHARDAGHGAVESMLKCRITGDTFGGRKKAKKGRHSPPK